MIDFPMINVLGANKNILRVQGTEIVPLSTTNGNSIYRLASQTLFNKHNLVSQNNALEDLEKDYENILQQPDFTPHDALSTDSKIALYVWGHSRREGIKGKIASLIYLILEKLDDVLGKTSDRKLAITAVEGLINDRESAKPQEKRLNARQINLLAKEVLDTLVERYNKYLE